MGLFSIIPAAIFLFYANAAQEKWQELDGIKCPPDVYSQEYDYYLKRSDQMIGFTLEPQVYGSEMNMNNLKENFNKLQIKDKGVYFIFSDPSRSSLYEYQCDEECGRHDYEGALRSCNSKHGGGCLDFAIVLDGTAQCLMIPRPEF
jgi:hypothetical protein